MNEFGRKTMVICYRWTNVDGESPRTKVRPGRPDRNHMIEHMDHVWSAKVRIGSRLSYRALKTGSLGTFFKIIKLWKFTLVIFYPILQYPTYKFYPSQNRFSFKFRVVLCRIRLFSTLILKIKWLGSGLPLNKPKFSDSDSIISKN